jgi:hypothetical protein
MKYIMALMDVINAIKYASGLIFYNISKGPQYLDANFENLPNFIELLFTFTFKNTCLPILKYIKTMFLYA